MQNGGHTRPLVKVSLLHATRWVNGRGNFVRRRADGGRHVIPAPFFFRVFGNSFGGTSGTFDVWDFVRVSGSLVAGFK